MPLKTDKTRSGSRREVYNPGIMKLMTFTALWLAISLAGCATAPTVPYWKSPQWVNALGQTIQRNIRYPDDAIKNTPTTGEFPHGKAIVQFTYDEGQLKSVQIMKSTGYEVLDKAIASEIPDIKPPSAEGQSARLPHRFELAINMDPFDYHLFNAIHNELQNHTQYPRSAVLRGDQGLVVARFHYLNGRVINPLIIKSSGSSELDRSVLRELSHISLPSPPS